METRETLRQLFREQRRQVCNRVGVPFSYFYGERPVWESGRIFTDITGNKYQAVLRNGQRCWGSYFEEPKQGLSPLSD